MDQQPLTNIPNFFSKISSAIKPIDTETIMESLVTQPFTDFMVGIGFATIFTLLIYNFMGYSIRCIKKPTKAELKKRKAELREKKAHKEELDNAMGQLLLTNPRYFMTYPVFAEEYPHHHTRWVARISAEDKAKHGWYR